MPEPLRLRDDHLLADNLDGARFVETCLAEAFLLMWGAYPGPASLVHKSRRIVAVNETCRQGGREPGMTCAHWGGPERHRGCRADEALAAQRPCRQTSPDGQTRYWLPLPGFPDYFIHFTTGPAWPAEAGGPDTAANAAGPDRVADAAGPANEAEASNTP